jgi:excisionase family DNA binding protein
MNEIDNLKKNMTQKIQKITTSEAAKILNISKTRVLQLINLNIIPAERVGRQFVLRKPDVLAARGRKSGRPRKKLISPEINQTVQVQVPANSQNENNLKLEDAATIRMIPKAPPRTNDYYRNSNKW